MNVHFDIEKPLRKHRLRLRWLNFGRYFHFGRQKNMPNHGPKLLNLNIANVEKVRMVIWHIFLGLGLLKA